MREENKFEHLPDSVKSATRMLWDYHRIGDEAQTKADLLLITGSHDLRVAERGAELILDNGNYGWIVVTGGFGKITQTEFNKSEAEKFADKMEQMGVDKNRLILETKATNSGDNFQFSRKLLTKLGATISAGIVVTHSYTERRMLATAEVQWPGVKWSAASPVLTLENYANGEVPLSRMISLMVGDLQRLRVYADKGFSSRQLIPDSVLSAFDVLVKAGYDSFLIAE